MTDLQKLTKSLTNLSMKGLAGVLVIIGGVFFAVSTFFATSLFTFAAILALIAAGVAAVIAFVKGNLR